ncbi:MAG TPA: hypothetical protein VKB93_20490 [Thermoanaerobaculia bacterium]|nr:hypothetical protein [Thermoanaerobaculia bacterium]
MKSLALAVPVVILLSSCAAYNAQHGRLDHQAAPAPVANAETAAAPMPEVTPDDPHSLQQALLIKQIDEFREDLKANGKYDCCVKPACRQCAMTAGECHCREVISANGPCCGECTQSWVEGKGNTEGVDREQVLAHLGCIRELYDKKVPEGITPPGTKKPD